MRTNLLLILLIVSLFITFGAVGVNAYGGII
jgi:hypothetical protein